MRTRAFLSFALLAAAAASNVACGGEDTDSPETADEADVKSLPPGAIRVATYNASLNRATEGELLSDLSTPDNEQAKTVAEIVQRVRPDILLVNEFDWDADGASAEHFAKDYLAVSQSKQKAVKFSYRFVPEVNTGEPSGFDFDHDGKVAGGGDAFGFGDFPGQYGFVVFSRYPIRTEAIRCFRKFLWKDMPGAQFPDDPKKAGKADWYTAEQLAVLRLSSKNHCDIPVDVDGEIVHVLAHHPTPPAFDGPEDRNGIRNHDEIRLFSDFITPGAGDYLVDDDGKAGGLPEGERFVVMGDHNSDPNDGSSQAVKMLLENPRVNLEKTPTSTGAPLDAKAQGGVNGTQKGDPRHDTGDFNDVKVGNLRLDYVLPSVDLPMLDARVYWPKPSEKTHPKIEVSDHRLVWVDLQVK